MYTDKPVSNQAELEAAITAGDYPVITDNGRYEIPKDIPRGHIIRVKGTAKPTLEASGTSSPRVVASGTSSPTVEAYDSSSPRVEASGTSSPTVVAYGTSSPRVVASGTSSPRVVAYDSSSPRVEASDSSSPTVVAYDSSSPRVVASGTSSPRVVASDSSSPTVVAYDSSSPRVVASGTSSPTVEAYDYTSVLHTGRGTLTATEHVTVRTNGDVTVTGGALTQRVPLTTNPRLVRDVLTHIETHPREWKQSDWATRTDCGTAYCYAGHAAVMSGAKVNIEDDTVEVATLPEDVRGRFVREQIPISLAAKTLLGIDTPTADRLFNGGNSLEDLRGLVGEICAGTDPQPAAPVAAE